MRKLALVIALLFVASFVPHDARAAVVTWVEKSATVQIDIYDKDKNWVSSGSGTIIDEDAHVLTNNHVIEPLMANDGSQGIICVTFEETEPPTCSFRFRTIETSTLFDLALLQITEVYMSGSWQPLANFLSAPPAADHLPYVYLDRYEWTEGVTLGEALQILGYPGAGGDTITYTKGVVSGFERAEIGSLHIPHKIKTDAKISPGNSGGSAFDEDNNFVGIPTEISAGYESIGYIIALPVINYFLNATLGEPPPACLDLVNGYYAGNGECYCNDGYIWSDTVDLCVEDMTSTGPIDQTFDAFVTEQIGLMSGVNTTLVNRLKGQILLQVQTLGAAWYLDPVTLKRYYMKDGPTAYQMLRSFGLGVTEADYGKIAAGNLTLKNRLKGRIILRVQAKGEAYYINPKDLSVNYLKDGAAAYQVMRNLSLGITNVDLNRVPIQRFVPIK